MVVVWWWKDWGGSAVSGGLGAVRCRYIEGKVTQARE